MLLNIILSIAIMVYNVSKGLKKNLNHSGQTIYIRGQTIIYQMKNKTHGHC